MIKTEDLCFEYKAEDAFSGVQVLKNINIHIKKGSFVAVIGHNGCGKSTLAKHFNAILTPTAGTVYVNGNDTRDRDLLIEIRKSAGMVFQNPDNQMVAAIVEDDVAFAPENLGIEPREIRKRVDSALASVDMLRYSGAEAARLSGGQKQRVAIAGVLAMQPECIILDESTSMLDPRGRREILDTVHALNREQGITVILITHFMEEAAEADRIIVMNDGCIELDGSPAGIFAQREKLTGIGLDTPQVTVLSDMLREKGIAIRGVITDIDSFCSEILRLCENRKDKTDA